MPQAVQELDREKLSEYDASASMGRSLGPLMARASCRGKDQLCIPSRTLASRIASEQQMPSVRDDVDSSYGASFTNC